MGVIPAAGHAARLQPISGSKEMLTVAGRPVIDYVLERMESVACDEIRVVTRPQKQDVVEHARRHGAVVVEGEPATVSESLLLGLRGLADKDEVLIGFPDTVWEPQDGYSKLLSALGGQTDLVLGLFRGADLRRSDVVVVDEFSTVARVQVKPRRPGSDLIWGCGAARRSALDGLTAHAEPGRHFDALARAGRVRGVFLSASWIDVGTREALKEAQSR